MINIKNKSEKCWKRRTVQLHFFPASLYVTKVWHSYKKTVISELLFNCI